MNEFLVSNARPYAGRYQLEFAETLGSGKDGIVLVGKHKDKAADVAILSEFEGMGIYLLDVSPANISFLD